MKYQAEVGDIIIGRVQEVNYSMQTLFEEIFSKK